MTLARSRPAEVSSDCYRLVIERWRCPLALLTIIRVAVSITIHNPLERHDRGRGLRPTEMQRRTTIQPSGKTATDIRVPSWA